MLESKGGKRIFSRGIGDLAITPNPRCDTHQGYSHLPSHQDEGAHYESLFTISGMVELKSCTRSSRPPSGFHNTMTSSEGHPDHQDHLGAVNHQE
jgi:hypothetical protein